MSLQVRLGKLSHRNMSLWTSVFFCGWASNSQVSPKASPRAIFKWKNLIEPLKLLSNELQLEKAECQHAPICAIMCQHGPTLQFVSCAEKDCLGGTVMMAWIWHVWINAMVFVPMAQAPPKAGAKELLYSLSLIDEFTSLFSPKVVFAGSLRKGFPQKHAFVDISVFLWLRKQQPRFA